MRVERSFCEPTDRSNTLRWGRTRAAKQRVDVRQVRAHRLPERVELAIGTCARRAAR
jgi:hypothetical protein